MANTIFDGFTTITPNLITGWESTQESRTVVHQVIGKSSPDITLKPAGLRNGTLELVFFSSASAVSARAFLSQARKFILATDESWLTEMHFVVSGSLSWTLDEQTQKAWIVSFEFQEVEA